MVETKHGTIRLAIKSNDVTLSFIHNIIVVTSPIGDQAPPLLAAITITPAKSQRSSCSDNNRRISIIITIVVVILSSTADMKNVIKAIKNNSFFLLWE